MGKGQLPPGLRFHPTDVELIKYYLKRKVLGKKLLFDGIVEVDIYKHAPWDLPDKSGWRSGDLKWYFFCPRVKKYSSGARMNRSTDLGYWKTTGKDRSVTYNNDVVGMIKTLVFHRGKAPRGKRTDWVMYEYRLEEKGLAESVVSQDAYVLCAIFKKDGPGPRNGAQYGAPFCEKDWDDEDNKDNEEEVTAPEQSLPSGEIAVPMFGIANGQNSPMPSSSIVSDVFVEGSHLSSPCAMLPYASQPPAPEFLPISCSHSILPLEAMPILDEDNIVARMNMFSTSVLVPNDNDQSMVVDYADGPDPYADGIDIFGDLGDIGSLDGWGEPGPRMSPCCDSIYIKEPMVQGDDDGIDIFDLGYLGSLGGWGESGPSLSTCCGSIYVKDPMVEGDDAQFMELIDLDVPLDISTEPQGHSYMIAPTSALHMHLFYPADLGFVAQDSLSSQLLINYDN